jgi:hypothetical protein
MHHQVGELYLQLYPKAMEIVSGAVKGCNVIRWREIAHDLTVDFLFFSKSFSVTYDSSLGMLKPFFSSYVRKRCMGVRERMQVELNRTQQMDKSLESKFISDSDHTRIFELTHEIETTYVWLQTKYYSSLKGKSFCLADVYLACIESTFKHGSVNMQFLRNYFKVDWKKTRAMLNKLRRVLKERECQRHTKF